MGSASWCIAQERKQNYLFYKGMHNGLHSFTEEIGEGGDYFNPEDVIPYVEEVKVTPKFKLGDKVKIVTNTCCSSNEVGDVGEVFKVDLAHDGCGVKVPGGPDYALWSKFSDLELVTEAKYVPKEGDTVKIIREGGGSKNKLGDIGTVTNADGVTFKVKVKGGADYANWQVPEDVELVESDVIFTTKDGVDIRNGDKVHWVLKIGNEVVLNSGNWNKDAYKVFPNLTYFSSEKLAIELKEKLENKTTTKTEKTMTIQEQIIKELGLQVGDTVKITHKVPNSNLGWTSGWVSDMDAAIGKEGTVGFIDTNGVVIKVEGVRIMYSYPAQVLQFVCRGPKYNEMKISKDYNAKVYADRIEVGCQTITMEDFEKLQKLVEEIKSK